MGDIGSWLHEYAEFLLEYSLEGQETSSWRHWSCYSVPLTTFSSVFCSWIERLNYDFKKSAAFTTNGHILAHYVRHYV